MLESKISKRIRNPQSEICNSKSAIDKVDYEDSRYKLRFLID
jgi:hypothetical protein